MGRGGKPFWEQNERVKMGRGVKRGVIGWVDGVVCASPNNCVPFFHSRALRSLSSVDSLSLSLSFSRRPLINPPPPPSHYYYY